MLKVITILNTPSTYFRVIFFTILAFMEIPIQTLHLFPTLDEKLIELLQSLTPEEWNLPTLAKQWTVKDIASHLLDGNIRLISIARDGHLSKPSEPIASYQDLVQYLNQLNADWVNATRRMSPAVLIELLSATGNEYYEQLKKLKPSEPAVFSVAWAGQTESPNWFHIAREYTEKWHHQQQIRDAVNKPGIMSREFFYPLIDTFMQALPHTYRSVQAEPATVVKVTVTTESGGEWFLERQAESWSLSKTQSKNIHAEVTLYPDTAWKLFTKGMSPAEAEQKIKFSGNLALGKPVLTMLSVMA